MCYQQYTIHTGFLNKKKRHDYLSGLEKRVSFFKLWRGKNQVSKIPENVLSKVMKKNI